MNLAPVFILFLGYGTLFLVGIGSSVWLISRRNPRRIALAMCIAPVVGLAETGLIFYPLILNDFLITKTTYPVIFSTLVISIGLLVMDVRRDPGAYRHISTRRTAVFVGRSFVLALGLLLLSPLVGGPSTQFWSSNPWDANNYMTMAEYAKDAPASYSLSPDHYQDIVQINPYLTSAFGAGKLMYWRPAAPNTLAWLSTLYRIPVYLGYYFAKLLYLALAFGIVLAIDTQLKMPLHWRIACAVVITVGFWTVFVVDIQAFSQLSSFSLNLLVLFTWLALEQEAPTTLLSRQRIFFGFALASVMAFYPETFITIMGAVAFYYALRIVQDLRAVRYNARCVLGLMVTGLIVLVFQLPDLIVTLNFMLGQAGFAVTTTLDWASYFFPWLYKSGMPLRDLWGLHFFQSANAGLSALFWLLTGLLGMALSILLIGGVGLAVLRRKLPLEHKLLAAPVIVFGGTGILFILLRQQAWVAGKGFSMGAPFAVIAVFFYAYFYARRKLTRIFQIALAAWAAMQFVTPLLHAVATVNPGAYPLYAQLLGHTPVAEIAPVMASLETHPAHTLGIDFADSTSFVSSAWTFAVANKTKIAVVSGTGNYFLLPPVWWQRSDTVPDQVLLSPQRDFLSAQHLGQLLVRDPSDFVLSAVTPEELDQAVMFPTITDPNGTSAIAVTDADPPSLIDGQAQPVRWTLQRAGEVPIPEQTVLRFWASGQTTFAIYLRYIPNFTGSLDIAANGVSITQQPLTSTDPQQTVFCVGKPGINTILLNYNVTRLLGLGRTDQRLLLQETLVGVNGKLDVGAPAEQLLVGDGWYAPEEWDAANVRWTGKESHLTLLTCKPPSTLRFRAFGPEGKSRTVTLALNGTSLGTVTLNAGWHEYDVTVPPGTYRENAQQRLDLSHDSADVASNDTRTLAAAYEWFVLN